MSSSADAHLPIATPTLRTRLYTFLYRRSDTTLALLIAFLGAAIYLAFGYGLAATPYDYYGRLGQAFSEGRWWLTDNPPWLNELIACGPGRFCVVYPPLPALLSIPLLPFGGTASAQNLVAQLCGGASGGILFLALRALGTTRSLALAGTLLSTFGTTLLFSSVDGRAWYAAHSVAVLFTSLALLAATRKDKLWLIGVALGLAALARLPVALAFPALALLAAQRLRTPFLPVLVKVIAGGAPFALFYFLYNFLRWGSLLDAGYVTLTHDDRFYEHGLFSLHYLPRHIYALLFAAPSFVDNSWAFIRFNNAGMSLLLTTPALLWFFAAFTQLRRTRFIAYLSLAALLVLLPALLHGTIGFAQFGYRFSLDAQPFLIALALAGHAYKDHYWERRPGGLFWVAVLVSIGINVYATIAITRFNYW